MPSRRFRPGRGGRLAPAGLGAVYPNEALLPAGTAGLDRDSVVAHQIRALSKGRLGALLRTIEDQELRAAVRAAVRVQLDLDG